MSEHALPSMPLAGWRPTRDTLHVYSRLLGRIRQALTPPQRHWQHVSLQVVPDGLTTTPLPIPDTEAQTFDMILGFGLRQGGHRLVVTSARDERYELPLQAQSPRHYSDAVLAFLAHMGIYPGVDQAEFSDTTPCIYEPASAERFAHVLNWAHDVLRDFREGLLGDWTPVRFWTHHFDLATTWLTGARVPGADPKDEERAEEQMTFGFSTGDAGAPDPYFYATAYPWPNGIQATELPGAARWHTEGWRGAQLMYDALMGVSDPRASLLEFFQAAYEAGSDYLRRSR